MKRFTRFLAAVLTAIFLSTSAMASNYSLIVSMAAEQAALKDISNLFPVGITLYSDSFPGMHVLYNSKESYVIKEGKNEINLEIKVTDDKLARKSLPAINIIFGKVNIPSKKGDIAYTKAQVTGVATERYEQLILKTGNRSLLELIKGLASPNAEEAISAYARFLIKMSEVVQFMENAVATKEDVSSDEFAASEDKQSEDKQSEDKQYDAGSDSKASSDDVPSVRDYFNRTILIYLDGTNLETDGECGTGNLLDLLRSDIPEEIKVYIVTGGTQKWHMNDPSTYRDYVKNMLYPDKDENKLNNAEKARISSMTDDLLKKYGTNISGLQLWEVVKTEGYNRMVNRQTYVCQYITDPQFFSRIIDYGAAYAPCDDYDLILWDHGGAYSGFGADDLFKEDYKKNNPDSTDIPDTGFSLKKLREALMGSDFIKNGGKFDLIGFDACQMANYEAVTTLKDLTDYYVGSEENEPGTGWNYQALFGALNADPKISTDKLGGKIVDGYITQYENNEATLSVIDMKKVTRLDSSISEFATLLLSELEKNDAAYYDILSAVGERSHFATKNGFNSSNLLDIRRLVTPFSSAEAPFSDELKSAGQRVLDDLNECVIYNKWQEPGVMNGGLSIYFPLSAYYVMDYQKIASEVCNNLASDVVKIYNEAEINEEYKLAIARFALMNIAGRFVGDDWTDVNITSKSELIDKIKRDYYWNEGWNILYETVGVNDEDQEDPTLKAFEKILSDRITKEDITVTLPEKDVHDQYDAPAEVKISDTKPITVGDAVNVTISLFDSDSHYLGTIGKTNQYSREKTGGEDQTIYSVDPFDQVWYLLNGQICSMYITKTFDDGSYQGYIPVCYWIDARSASTLDMLDNESRTDYLKRAAREEKVTTVYLNVFSDPAGENFSIGSYSTVSSDDGSVGAASIEFDKIEKKYYELLGGAGDLYTIQDTPRVFSLGTVYYEAEKELTVTTAYVEDISHEYSLSDVYGNEYSLIDSYFGEGKGLNNFYNSIPVYDEQGNEVETMTYAKSQELAVEVREDAKKAAEEGTDAEGEVEPLELQAAKDNHTLPVQPEVAETDKEGDNITALTEEVEEPKTDIAEDPTVLTEEVKEPEADIEEDAAVLTEKPKEPETYIEEDVAVLTEKPKEPETDIKEDATVSDEPVEDAKAEEIIVSPAIEEKATPPEPEDSIEDSGEEAPSEAAQPQNDIIENVEE